MKKSFIAISFLVLLAFLIPIEHKYDKLFRYFSLTLIPQGLEITKGYDKKIYFYVSDIIAIFLLSMGLLWFKIPFKRFFANPLWVVFACAVASIIASPFINYPLAYIRLFQLLTPIVVFSFLSNAFEDEEKSKMTHAIFIAIVAAGLMQTVIAITQYFNQAPLGLRILGESNCMCTIPMEDGRRWIFDNLFAQNSIRNEIVRAAGTIPHPNVYAGFLVVSIISTYFLIAKGILNKWFWGLTLPFQFFAMAIAYSRSAIFACALATFIWFIQAKDKFLAVMIGVSVLLSAFLLQEQCISRGGIVNYNAVAKASDSVRLFHQKIAFEIMEKVPFLGLGFGQFSERAIKIFPENTPGYVSVTAPHNIYLFLACETGLISLAAFLLFIITLLWHFIKAPKTLETTTLSSIFIAFLFIGFCDFYPILFQQGKLMFFAVAGLLAAHVQYLKKREPIHV